MFSGRTGGGRVLGCVVGVGILSDLSALLDVLPLLLGGLVLSRPGVSGGRIPWKDLSHGTSQQIPARAS